MNLCKYVVIVFATIFNIAVAQTLTAKQYEVGTVIKTSKGFNFERYQDPVSKAWGWLDLNARIVWYDHLYYGRSITAFAYCHGQPLVSLDIPQNSELIAATKNGAAEILRSTSEVWSWQQSRSVKLYSFKMNCEFYFPPFKDISQCFTKSMYSDESNAGICVERI